MDYKDALDTAIIVERELGERFTMLTEILDHNRNREAAEVFQRMAAKQSQQVVELESERRSTCGETESRVSVNAIHRELDQLDHSDLHAHMTSHQALRAVLTCEKQLRNYFAQTHPVLTDDRAKALFEKLGKVELGHEEILAKELAALGPEETTHPEHFADEPTAH